MHRATPIGVGGKGVQGVVFAALAGLLLAMALAACANGTAPLTPGGKSLPSGKVDKTNSTTGGSSGTSGVNGLTSAQFAVCGQQAQTLATYLNTGQPTSYDPTFGDQRQEVLSLSGAQRSLYIRQQADAYIEKCDQEQQQTVAQDSEQAAAASAAAEAAAATQAASPACQAVGGAVSASTNGSTVNCNGINYLGSDGSTYYGASAPMDPTDGQFSGPRKRPASEPPSRSAPPAITQTPRTGWTTGPRGPGIALSRRASRCDGCLTPENGPEPGDRSSVAERRVGDVLNHAPKIMPATFSAAWLCMVSTWPQPRASRPSCGDARGRRSPARPPKPSQVRPLRRRLCSPSAPPG